MSCGILERGCLLLECRHCGHRELVGFSCQCRGFCPACTGTQGPHDIFGVESDLVAFGHLLRRQSAPGLAGQVPRVQRPAGVTASPAAELLAFLLVDSQ
ncbi:transposase zinc-binding domain-containing protein [Myxococcota bacterium]